MLKGNLFRSLIQKGTLDTWFQEFLKPKWKLEESKMYYLKPKSKPNPNPKATLAYFLFLSYSTWLWNKMYIFFSSTHHIIFLLFVIFLFLIKQIAMIIRLQALLFKKDFFLWEKILGIFLCSWIWKYHQCLGKFSVLHTVEIYFSRLQGIVKKKKKKHS